MIIQTFGLAIVGCMLPLFHAAETLVTDMRIGKIVEISGVRHFLLLAAVLLIVLLSLFFAMGWRKLLMQARHALLPETLSDRWRS